MTVTLDRKEKVDFTHYHDKVTQVLVQKRPKNWRQMTMDGIDDSLVKNALGLIGKTIHVRKNSSYYERLKNLEEEIGGRIDIETVPGNVSTDALIRRVARGEIEYTIADKNIAQVNKTYHPDIDIRTDISFPQRIAWAVRKNSPELLEAVNDWIVKMRKKNDYYVIYNKYFKNRKLQTKRVRSELYSRSSGKISPYDDLFKEFGEKVGIDWRLLASQAYQESQFRPKVASWAGAKGLMQLMPATARRFGAKDPSDPRQSVKAGVNYLEWLQGHWKSIEDSVERQKFMLASYNVGEGHVKDAQRLAEKYGKDPKKWENIAEFLLKKSKKEYYNDPVVNYGYCRGREPVNYVREIMDRFEHYAEFVPRHQEA
jgi:membrane-bound lytic murein transglycosylase F